jgi:hypothetical protein
MYLMLRRPRPFARLLSAFSLFCAYKALMIGPPMSGWIFAVIFVVAAFPHRTGDYAIAAWSGVTQRVSARRQLRIAHR